MTFLKLLLLPSAFGMAMDFTKASGSQSRVTVGERAAGMAGPMCVPTRNARGTSASHRWGHSWCYRLRIWTRWVPGGQTIAKKLPQQVLPKCDRLQTGLSNTLKGHETAELQNSSVCSMNSERPQGEEARLTLKKCCLKELCFLLKWND